MRRGRIDLERDWGKGEAVWSFLESACLGGGRFLGGRAPESFFLLSLLISEVFPLIEEHNRMLVHLVW